jgi:hypothetical protein
LSGRRSMVGGGWAVFGFTAASPPLSPPTLLELKNLGVGVDDRDGSNKELFEGTVAGKAAGADTKTRLREDDNNRGPIRNIMDAVRKRYSR